MYYLTPPKERRGFFLAMKKLWQKGKVKLQNIIDEYCFKEGVELDSHLVVYDVLGSIAHAKMLAKIGIITDQEFLRLKKCLNEIISLYEKKKFNIEPNDEDVHTKIENYLTDKLGALGKKIHTARSRNDQIAVDMRLFSKAKLIDVAMKVIQTAKAFTDHAKKYEWVPMPGYTHMQKAMPSSIGMWLSSFGEQLIDLLILLSASYELNDQSPLGSGASYGVSLPIDRELTAKLLGFAKVQNNSLYSQISRPTIQLSIMHVLSQIMLAASRFAQDLLLFTTSEFNFFSIDESFVTGSSIMPQKKNFDLMEHVRAKTKLVIGYEEIIGSMTTGLPSGYVADFGETKGLFMKSIEIVLKTLEALTLVVKAIEPNVEVLKKACTPELFAAHLSYQYVIKGMAFRDAYVKVGKSLDTIPQFDSVGVLKESNHTGGPGKLNLEKLAKHILEKEMEWKQKQRKFQKAISLLSHY